MTIFLFIIGLILFSNGGMYIGLGIIFMLPAIYKIIMVFVRGDISMAIYEEIERSKYEKNNRKRFESLYHELLNIAKKEHCTCIYVDNIKDSNDTIRLSTAQGGIIYRLSDHGYNDIDVKTLRSLFLILEQYTKGYLSYKYKEVGGGYNSTIISYSTGFTPTGSTGLYANRIGGGSGEKITAYYLYLGKTAKEQRKLDIKKRYEH